MAAPHGRSRRLFEHLRVSAWEIDGTLYPVDPTCVWTQETDDQASGFSISGCDSRRPARTRSRSCTARSRSSRSPIHSWPGADPFGLDGRRVLVKGEVLGDVLDEQFVHSYELVVMKGR
jgi:hypothetical protein